tara:strand:+ start:20 stop:178 length:159 start_codon:yes stop_codon:yes gene_type:complete
MIFYQFSNEKLKNGHTYYVHFLKMDLKVENSIILTFRSDMHIFFKNNEKKSL